MFHREFTKNNIFSSLETILMRPSGLNPFQIRLAGVQLMLRRVFHIAFLGFLTLLVCFTGSAQTLPKDANSLWTCATPDGLNVLWTLPTSGVLPFSYDVLRSPAGRNRYVVVGHVCRLQESEWRTLRYPFVQDSLRMLINTGSSERCTDLERHEALQRLRTLALVDPLRYAVVLGLSFTDTTCKSTSTYDYRITSNDQKVAECFSIRPSAIEPLPVPAYVQAKPDQNCIHFVWSTKMTAAKGIRGCYIYRRESPDHDFIRLNSQVAMSLLRPDSVYTYSFFDDCSTVPLVPYEYSLSYVDVFGREGPRSAVLRASTSSARRASSKSPRITHTDVVENRVTIHWDSPEDPSILGFNLYRGVLGSPQRVRVNDRPISATMRSYNDFIGDVPYNYLAYSLSTIDSSGFESRLSYDYRVPVIDQTPPANADYFECSRSSDLVHLRWSLSSARDVQGYEIQRSTAAAENYEPIMPLQNIVQFTDSVQAFRSKSLWYQIRSVDLRGNVSSWSDPLQAFSSSMQSIVAPNLIVGEAQEHAVSLSWFPSTQTIVSGYIINRYEDTTKVPVNLCPIPISANSTHFEDSTAVPLRRYWYELLCVDESGEFSQPSARVSQMALLRNVRPKQNVNPRHVPAFRQPRKISQPESKDQQREAP